MAFIFQSAIQVSLRSGISVRCGWLSFSRVLYSFNLTHRLQSVAVGFHFPECYTTGARLFKICQLRLAFIFQSAIPVVDAPVGCICCGWLSFSRVLYPHNQGCLRVSVAVGFHFPECYTPIMVQPLERLLRLAFIFQSAIRRKKMGHSSSSCGWLSFSRVLYTYLPN